MEIITFIFVAFCLLYLLSYWCQKRRQKKLARLTSALQNVTVQPDVARVPVFEMQQPHPTASNPPPAYHVAKAMASPVYPDVTPKSQAEQLGAKLMAKYT